MHRCQTGGSSMKLFVTRHCSIDRSSRREHTARQGWPIEIWVESSVMQSAGVWRHFSSYRDDVLPASSAPVLVLFRGNRGSQGSSQLIIIIGGLLQLRRYAGCPAHTATGRREVIRDRLYSHRCGLICSPCSPPDRATHTTVVVWTVGCLSSPGHAPQHCCHGGQS